VTAVTYLFIVNKKEKEIQKKRNIKSRKINKRKRKMLVFIHIITRRRLDQVWELIQETDVEIHKIRQVPGM